MKLTADKSKKERISRDIFFPYRNIAQNATEQKHQEHSSVLYKERISLISSL